MSEHVTSLEALVARLEADGVAFKSEPGQVWIPVDRDGMQTTAMILWPPQYALLTVIVPLPFAAGEHTAALSEAIVRLNHASIVPGFGFDHEHAQPYFRLVQPRGADGGIAVGEIQRMIATAVQSAARFGPMLAGVAAGELEPSDVLGTEEADDS